MTARTGRRVKRSATSKSTFKDISEVIYTNNRFSIDDHVAKLFRDRLVQPRWQQSEKAPISFGRRTLEVAFHAANGELDKNTKKDIEDWKNSGRFATRAKSVVDQFLKFARGGPIQNSNLSELDPSLFVPYFRRIRIIAAARSKRRVSRPEIFQEAKTDADILLKTSRLLRDIAEESEAQRKSLASQYQNPGIPEKLAFVRVMMEGWIFLTGKRPSEKNTHFASFISAGWTDLTGQEDVSWEQSIRKARESLLPRDSVEIAERGPSWK
jgi:hypothetical protein